MKRIFTIASSLMALSLSLSNSAQAAGGLPYNKFDIDNTVWSSTWAQTSAQYSSYWSDKAKQGYYVLSQHAYKEDGKKKYSGVFLKNYDGRAWASHRNLTDVQYHDKWLQYKDRGMRPTDIGVYVDNGTTLFSGAWIQNKEGLGWASFRNLTNDQYKQKFDSYSQRYLPVDIEGYPSAKGLLYSVIWVENAKNIKWASLRNMSAATYADKFKYYRDLGYRVHQLTAYNYDGQTYYAAIWYKNDNGRAWAAWRDMSYSNFQNKWEEMRDAGLRLKEMKVYQVNGKTRYLGVWRQEGDRWDWSLKNQVDQLVENFQSSTNLPGVSVAIADNGKLTYLRGVGYADIAANKKANSHTICRTASVAKAIAGVLTLRHQEAGDIDVANLTSSYINNIPDHHTHTIAQLLSNRSGVRHYGGDPAEYGVDHFEWASDAVPLMWDDPLLFPPGTDYEYSTHGYSFVAFALENQTGKSVTNLVKDMADELGLSSLRVEDRSVGSWYRAQIYNTDNTIASADDISWKSLGGGLEISAYDLTRFGMKLLDGSALTDTTPLWTVPDNLKNYALGWNVGTHNGFDVVTKGGDQLGSDSNIRIYPNNEIVISVLTNRAEIDSSNEANDLAKAIGLLMTDNGL